MKYKLRLTVILALTAILLLSSCSSLKSGNNSNVNSTGEKDSSIETASIDLNISIDEVVETSNDIVDDTVNTPDEKITFNDSDIKIEKVTVNSDGTFAYSDDTNNKNSGVTIDGNATVITKAGVYVISGTFNDGQIVVDVGKEEKVELILNGVSITCSDSAAIYGKSSDLIKITLADGTANTVSDGDSYTGAVDGEPNAAIFSKDDITFSGTGSLTVNGNYKNGISSTNDIKFIGGNITVNSVNNAIRGKDSVKIGDGCALTIRSGGDAIKATNDKEEGQGFVIISGGTLNITSAMDGLDAFSGVKISAGTINITTSGGSSKTITDDTSAKAIKSDTAVEITGGTFNLDTADSAVKSDGTIAVTGGTFTITAGVDGFEAAGALAIANGTFSLTTGSGKTLTASTSYKALKSDSTILIGGGSFTINSSDDALHCAGALEIKGGAFSISSNDDGIHSDTSTTISGGKINIIKSYEGLEGQSVAITGGEVRITASDDGINSAGGSDTSNTGRPGQGNFSSGGNNNITISGGFIVVNANGDGLDANGSITMSAGTLLVCGPTANDNGALDYNSTFNMTGGILIAAGSSGMAQGISSTSTQYGLLACFNSQAANTIIRIQDSDGNDVITFAPSKQFASVAVCTPTLKKGATYSLLLGGSCTGTLTDGLYSGGTYSGGTNTTTFTVSSILTTYGSTGGMGGPGGNPPGRP